MNRFFRNVARLLPLYALLVVANEYRLYGTVWVFGPDGWPMAIGGDFVQRATHSKAAAQLYLAVFAALLASAVVLYRRAVADYRRLLPDAERRALVEAYLSIEDDIHAMPEQDREAIHRINVEHFLKLGGRPGDIRGPDGPA